MQLCTKCVYIHVIYLHALVYDKGYMIITGTHPLAASRYQQLPLLLIAGSQADVAGKQQTTN